MCIRDRVKPGEEEGLDYNFDPEGAAEPEPKHALPYPFRTGALVANFPTWIGISHVAKREAERDKRDGKTFGCSYAEIMQSHEVAKVKSPYPLPRSRVTGKEGGPESVLARPPPDTPEDFHFEEVPASPSYEHADGSVATANDFVLSLIHI